jgi:tetratricopeptide (TPR) repeat protein
VSSEAESSEQPAVPDGTVDGGALNGGDDDLLAAAVRNPDGDWLDVTPTGQLPDLASWLLRHSMQLAAEGRGEGALAAAVAATRVYRVLFDAEPTDPADLPARLGIDNGYVQALSRQVQLLVAAGRIDEVHSINDQLVAARDRIEQRAGRLLGAAAAPAPAPATRGEERLTLADLDRLGPGWVERTDRDDLSVLSRLLADLAEDLAQSGQPEPALRAVTEAVRAESRLVERTSDDELRRGERWQWLSTLLGRKIRLLSATGRHREITQVNQQLAALNRRLQSYRPPPPAAAPASAPPPPPPLAAPPPADILHQLAGRLREAGDRSAARPVLERELALREQSHGPDSPEVASLLWELATSYYRPHRHYRLARNALERTRQIMESRHGPRSVEVSYVLGDLAAVLRDQDDLPAAKSIIERRLAILEEIRGPDNRGTAGCLEQLATVSAQLGDLKGAGAALTRAVAIYERGRPGPDADRARRALVSSLLQTGDPDAIRAVYEELIADRRETVGKGADEVVALLAELGQVALALGEPETARSARRRIVDARELAHGPDTPAVAAATGDLATLLWRLGDREAAVAAVERAVAIDERAGAAAPVALARDLARLGGMRRQLADLPAARAAYEQALRGYERALGTHHWEVAHTLRQLSELLAELGEQAAATAAAERAELIERWGDS